jgi:hypothetical protein
VVQILSFSLSLNAYTRFEIPTVTHPTSSVFEISQQNQQLDLEDGCNAINPRDFVVRGRVRPPPPTNHPSETV